MLSPDFKEMLSCLQGEKVEFIIVGAYALAAHGLPRATGDIDILIRNTLDNAQKVFSALLKFGAPTSNLTAEDFTASGMVLQIGVEPCRIDLLTEISGVGFDRAWENRVCVALDDLKIFVLSRADLLTNKLAAGRDKDQSDIAWLKKNQMRDS
jgi:hypothetical protein